MFVEVFQKYMSFYLFESAALLLLITIMIYAKFDEFLFLTEDAYSHGTTPDKEVWPSPFKCQPAPIWTLNLVQIVLEQTLRLIEIVFVWSYKFWTSD